jgi:hypothetical protein
MVLDRVHSTSARGGTPYIEPCGGIIKPQTVTR